MKKLLWILVLGLLLNGNAFAKKTSNYMVGATGFEPGTPAVSRQCSTAELRTENPQNKINQSSLAQLWHTRRLKWVHSEDVTTNGTYK